MRRTPRRRVRSVGAVLAVVLSAVTACTSTTPHTGPTPHIDTDPGRVPDVSAWTFVTSVGVNTHIGYTDTGYRATGVVARLVRELGVRYVRNGLYPDRPDQVAGLRRLAESGVALDLIMGGRTTIATRVVNRSALDELRTLAPHTDAVEAPNEADCGIDPRWSTALREYGAALGTALHRSPSLAHAARIAPSFCHLPSIRTYGRPGSPYNTANLHVYFNGSPPESMLDSAAMLASGTQGGHLPLVISETGYHDAPSPALSDGSATQQTVADYDVRTVLEAVRIGVRRTYFYELLDERPSTNYSDREMHFGLVDADYTKKPVFDALASMLHDIAGGNPRKVRHATGDTSFQPTVHLPNKNTRAVVIADPGGDGGTVALWLAAPSATTLPDNRVTATVTLPATMTATARTPSRGNAARSLGHGTRFRIQVGPAATLVHFGEH